MNRTWKAVLTCLLCILCMMILISQSSAQVGFGFPPLFNVGCFYECVWCYPSSVYVEQSFQVPVWEDPFEGEGDILIENFEYWDSPFNHGWRVPEPY